MKATIKNKLTELFVEKTGEVLNSFPSLYSKDDVHSVIVKLHNAIDSILDDEFENGVVDNSTEPSYTLSQIEEVLENKIDFESFCDYDRYSAEFSLSGNEIELDDVEINFSTSSFIDTLGDKLKQLNQVTNS